MDRDVLFKGSIGRTDFPRGDHQQLLDSIQRECFSLPDETQLFQDMVRSAILVLKTA